MALRSGSFDRPITLERRAVPATKDSFGARKAEWSELCKARAAVKPLASSERIAAGTKLAVEVASFTIRWRPDLAPTKEDRIRYEGRSWAITGIREIGRHSAWELTAEVVGA